MRKSKSFLKIKHNGASQIEHYSDLTGKVLREKIMGAVEDDVVMLAGSKIAESSLLQRERTLYLAAIFFQRAVSRTPFDENYWFTDSKGELRFHKADKDVIRNSWVASYNNKKVTVEMVMNSCGVTFDTFNDKPEIENIYKFFQKKFTQRGDRAILKINIENTHPRFSLLEYGEYEKDGSVKEGEKYYHGVDRGYSIQAPYGMLRITEAEFKELALSMPTPKLLKDYVSKSQRLKKVPSKSKMKELKRAILDKTHLSNSDINSVERIFEK